MRERIARETPGAYFINQFGNPDNPAAHQFVTGPEILAQMSGVGGLGLWSLHETFGVDLDFNEADDPAAAPVTAA